MAAVGIGLAVRFHRHPLRWRRRQRREERRPASGTNFTFGGWGDGQVITWAGSATKVFHTVRRVSRRRVGEADEVPISPGEVDPDHPLIREMLGQMQQSLRPLVVTTDPAEAERYNRVFSEAGISYSVQAEERNGVYEARLLVAEQDFARAKALIGPDRGAPGQGGE